VKLFSTLTPEQRWNLSVLFASGLLFWTSLTANLPVLPNYILDVGGTTQQVGLVMGCFAIGLLASRSYLGNLADDRGRKTVLAIGTAVVGLAPLLYLSVESLPLLGLARGIHGISIAAFAAGYTTLVVDISPPQKRGELIGHMSLVVPVGLAIGPLLGGYVQVEFGYVALFALAAATGLLAFAFALQIREARVTHSPQTRAARPSFWKGLFSDRLRTPVIMLSIMGLVFGGLVSYLAPFARNEIGLENAGQFFFVSAIVSFSVRVLAGRASDRFGRGLFISCGLVSYGGAMLLLAIAQVPQHVLLAGTLQGVGAGTLIPMSLAMMADRSEPHERGRVNSQCLFGFDVGIGLGGPVLGALAGVIGYRGMFVLATVLAALALVVFVTRSSKDLVHSWRFATGRGRDLYAIESGNSA